MPIIPGFSTDSFFLISPVVLVALRATNDLPKDGTASQVPCGSSSPCTYSNWKRDRQDSPLALLSWKRLSPYPPPTLPALKHQGLFQHPLPLTQTFQRTSASDLLTASSCSRGKNCPFLDLSPPGGSGRAGPTSQAGGSEQTSLEGWSEGGSWWWLTAIPLPPCLAPLGCRVPPPS